MSELKRQYICIDLKSFYASVECAERGLDPLTTRLVVADESRTEKTICLAVSPALKAYDIPGRPRLFEVNQRLKEIKAEQKKEIDYIIAKPRMALYMQYSTNIYNIYLEYIAPEDINVYSIDEVFIDATAYLRTYGMTARELATKMISEVYRRTGITATAGIGTNMYLGKIAMDIVAKHAEADENGVRIAELDEMSYRQLLWNHRPITDFWRIGRGYAKKLESVGIYTMGDVARCSIGKSTDYYNEDMLYKLFGVNAELLIDHAWGYEPCTIEDVRNYRPENNSLSSGQVLQNPYEFDKAKLVVKEMADMLALDLVDKGLVTNQVVLTVGYDVENLNNPDKSNSYKGEITTDHYGRRVPKHAHGTENLDGLTSSAEEIISAAMTLYDRIVDKKLLVRRIVIVANHVVSEDKAKNAVKYEQFSLFDTYNEEQQRSMQEHREREHAMQQAVLSIKKKYGKNAIVRGMNLEEGATAMNRNKQIGGHRA